MNLKKVQFANEILIEQMNHWALFPIALAIMGISVNPTLKDPTLFLWFLCSLFPFVLFIIREKVEQIFPFIVLHLLVIFVAVLIPVEYGGYRFMNVAFAVYYVFSSIRMRYKRNTQYSSPIQLQVSIGITLVSILVFQKDIATTKWILYYSIRLIAVIALFFIIFYIQRYLDFLNVNKSSAGILPAKDMFQSGLGLVLGYTGLSVIVLVLVMNIKSFSAWGEAIKSVFMKFLKWLFSLLPESDKRFMPTEQDTSTVGSGIFGDSGRTYLIWEVLQYLFLLALFIGLIVLLIKLILKLIEFVQGRFKKTVKSEVEEDEFIDFREKVEIEKPVIKKKTNPFDAFSPTERIRKMYKKKLLASTYRMSEAERDKLGIRTAKEWEAFLQTKGMATIYEDARYSGRALTPEDVKRMKDACKSEEESS